MSLDENNIWSHLHFGLREDSIALEIELTATGSVETLKEGTTTLTSDTGFLHIVFKIESCWGLSFVFVFAVKNIFGIQQTRYELSKVSSNFIHIKPFKDARTVC